MKELEYFTERIGQDISYKNPLGRRITLLVTIENVKVLHGMQQYGYTF